MNKKLGRPRKDNKVSPSDIIICNICGNKYTRSNRVKHESTKIHKIYELLDKDTRDKIKSQHYLN